MRDLVTKVDNTAPAASGRLSAPEFESFYAELKHFCTTAGISLDPSGSDVDLYMMAQAAARHASGGIFGQDTGAANHYVVGSVGSFKPPKALFLSMGIRFYPGAGNTGASDLNAFGIGTKPLWDEEGSPLTGGEIVASRLVEAYYDPTLNTGTGAWKLAPWSNALLFSGGGGGGGSGGGWAGWLAPCRTVSTANITLSGEQTIRGVSVVAGDRVLVNGQTLAKNNGVYVASAGAWARATDLDENSEMKAGVSVVVTEGDYADSLWSLETDDPIVVGTDSVSFVNGQKSFGFSSSLSSAGISANVFTLVSPSSATGNLGTSTYSNGVFTCGAKEAGWWGFSLSAGFSPTSVVNDWDAMVARIVGPSGDFAQHNVQGAGNQGNTADVTCFQKLTAGETVSFYGYHLNTSGNFGAQVSGTRIGRA